MNPGYQTGCSGFDGLADDGQADSAWDGDSDGCFWFAVGTSYSYQGNGIPAYTGSDANLGGLITERMRLWVRKN